MVLSLRTILRHLVLKVVLLVGSIVSFYKLISKANRTFSGTRFGGKPLFNVVAATWQEPLLKGR